MTPAEQKRILDAITKNAEQGEFELDPYMQRSPDYLKDTNKATNLQEDALSLAALDRFKGKVPNQSDKVSKKIDFIEEMREQFMPDSKARIIMPEGIKKPKIDYNPVPDLISLNPNRQIDQLPGDLFHEGGHELDAKADDYGDINKIKTGPEVKSRLMDLYPDEFDKFGNAKNPRSLLEKIHKRTDINTVKEALKKGHHGLKRGATFAQANLPRLLKGLPLLGAAGAALISQDASAAVPLLGEADDIGESPEEEKIMLAEDKARKAYEKSPAKMARLQKLMGR